VVQIPPPQPINLGVLSVRSDGLVWNEEAAGSNPATQTRTSVYTFTIYKVGITVP